MLIQFGLVGEAAHGGHSNPAFDLLVGLTVLAVTWVGYSRGKSANRISLWAAIGVSAICAVFLYSGISGLLR